jgi:hypothetical protein
MKNKPFLKKVEAAVESFRETELSAEDNALFLMAVDLHSEEIYTAISGVGENLIQMLANTAITEYKNSGNSVLVQIILEAGDEIISRLEQTGLDIDYDEDEDDDEDYHTDFHQSTEKKVLH